MKTNDHITLVGTPVDANLDYIIEEESDLSYIDTEDIFKDTYSYREILSSSKGIILRDYLVLYEMNDKCILTIYNAVTGNLLYCARIDYLNVDGTGCMNPLSNCKIYRILEPDTIVITLNKEAERLYLAKYETYGVTKD